MTEANNPRVAVITGGGNGIGRATATLFAQHGYAVAVWDTSEAAGAEAVQAIAAAGGVAVFHRVDVSKPASAVEAATAVRARFGRIDALINNAGIVRDAQLVKVHVLPPSLLFVRLVVVTSCDIQIVPSRLRMSWFPISLHGWMICGNL